MNAAFLTLAEDQEGETDEAGPIHTISIFSADDPTEETSNIVSSTYELHGNSLQDDILNHRLVKKFAPVTIAKLSDVISKALAGSYETTALLEAAVTAAIGTDSNSAFGPTFFNSWIKRRGNMAFQQAQYVFRATIVITRRGAIPALFGGADKVYTTAKMKTEAGPTPRYVEAIDAVDALAPNPATAGHTWGWLKQAATLTNVAGNREAVQLEYYLAEWESWVYPSA